MKNEVKIYFAIVALSAIGLGFSHDIISNFFKEAYGVTALQRGFLEFPRELPGMLCVLLVIVLSFMGDIKIAIVAQALSIIGIMALGLFQSSFGVMVFFIFINSMGMHLYMPLQDSIGMALVEDSGKIGKRMGQYKGTATGFAMLASIIVFFGFRNGIFSFESTVKWSFILAAIALAGVLILYLVLDKKIDHPMIKKRKFNLKFRKEYKYYYTLVIMFGVQKQIMLVYGPWVLIELLGKKADILAMLGIFGAFAGMFFIPALGRWLDRFGIRAMLFLDAFSFIFAYLIFVFDKMSMQMGMVRTLYLKSIALDPSEVTSTLSLGISMDHIVYFAAAMSCINLFVAFKVPDDCSPGTS